jgi:hypothetical protein
MLAYVLACWAGIGTLNACWHDCSQAHCVRFAEGCPAHRMYFCSMMLQCIIRVGAAVEMLLCTCRVSAVGSCCRYAHARRQEYRLGCHKGLVMTVVLRFRLQQCVSHPLPPHCCTAVTTLQLHHGLALGCRKQGESPRPWWVVSIAVH